VPDCPGVYGGLLPNRPDVYLAPAVSAQLRVVAPCLPTPIVVVVA
jgi:hypothetical protein